VSVQPDAGERRAGELPLGVSDVDALRDADHLALSVVVDRILKAQEHGASLYLSDLDPLDMKSAIDYAPEIVAGWLEGSAETTYAFKQRVRMAEGLYLALCEALLDRDPRRGVVLWRALRSACVTRYVGKAGIEELLHMLFRVANTDPIAALRAEVLTLAQCHSDNALLHLALAAQINNGSEWLSDVIRDDLASTSPWKVMRGLVLQRFQTSELAKIPGRWPEGEAITTMETLKRVAAFAIAEDGWARHWWRAYLSAPTLESANADWTLFIRAADLRSRVWLEGDMQDAAAIPHRERKLLHFISNRSALQRSMEKKHAQLSGHFLSRDIAIGQGPWTNA
jgi:hypothetical protein